MEPLTAIGLASNVLSFAQFTAQLIQVTKEIHSSADGATADIVNLDTINGRLKILNDGFESSSHYSVSGSSSDGVIAAWDTLKELSRVCRSDCESLLNAIAKLKAGSAPSSKWRCFRVALRKVWDQSKIDDLENRLSNTQVMMVLNICVILQEQRTDHAVEFRKLQRQSLALHANQDEKLGLIAASLARLEGRLANREDHPFTTDEIGMIERQFKELSLSERAIKKEQSVLRSLLFESRPVRHQAIAEAHQHTFRWALEMGEDETENDYSHNCGLGNWLQHDRGIFWVSGKPGSGKSTLMKFVTDELRTHQLLSEHLNAKSHHGLLQSLLYDIFRQCPQQISTACPDRWLKPDDNPPWTTRELKASLESILSNDLPGVKFCFFIDGLDEYEGDQVELCRIFKSLGESSHIKLCLSSRPWNVFDEAFGRGIPKLRVHELTKQDIRLYATSRLQEHPRWNTAITPEQGESLIEDISTRAWGVFLWAVLVIKLVREGLTNRDRFSDMRRRINKVPEELQDFFRQILDTVEPFYRSKMSTTLQIAVAAKDPLHFLLYEFHDQEYDDVDFALMMPVQHLSLNEINETREVTICRLESRTRGLLEIQNGSDTVTFLHRTVKDFLDSLEMTQYLAETSATDFRFRANLSITKALLAWMKSSVDVGHGNPRAEPVVRKNFGSFNLGRRNQAVTSNHPVFIFEKMLVYAAEMDIEAFPEGDADLATILDATSEVLVNLLNVKNTVVGDWKPEALFREQLVTSCVYNYFQAEVTRDKSYIECIGSRLAMHLASPELEVAKTHPHLYRQGIDILHLVVKAGCIAPDEVDDDGVTSWSTLVGQLTSKRTRAAGRFPHLFLDLLECETFSLLLQLGADPNARIWDSSIGNYTPAWGLFLRLALNMPADPMLEKAYLDCFEAFIGPRTTLTRLDISESFVEPWRAMKPDASHRRSPFVASIAVRLLFRASELKAIGIVEEIDKALEQLADRTLVDSLKKGIPEAGESRNKMKRSASVSTTDRMSSSRAGTQEYVESIEGDGKTRRKVARTE